MALIDRAPRNATVTATSPMKLIVIGKREFSGLLDESAELPRAASWARWPTGSARRTASSRLTG